MSRGVVPALSAREDQMAEELETTVEDAAAPPAGTETLPPDGAADTVTTETQDSEEKKQRRGYQARIDELVRKQHEAEEKAAAAIGENRALREHLASVAQNQTRQPDENAVRLVELRDKAISTGDTQAFAEYEQARDEMTARRTEAILERQISQLTQAIAPVRAQSVADGFKAKLAPNLAAYVDKALPSFSTLPPNQQTEQALKMLVGEALLSGIGAGDSLPPADSEDRTMQRERTIAGAGLMRPSPSRRSGAPSDSNLSREQKDIAERHGANVKNQEAVARFLKERGQQAGGSIAMNLSDYRNAVGKGR
jgi:hypothetical protein